MTAAQVSFPSHDPVAPSSACSALRFAWRAGERAGARKRLYIGKEEEHNGDPGAFFSPSLSLCVSLSRRVSRCVCDVAAAHVVVSVGDPGDPGAFTAQTLPRGAPLFEQAPRGPRLMAARTERAESDAERRRDSSPGKRASPARQLPISGDIGIRPGTTV